MKYGIHRILRRSLYGTHMNRKHAKTGKTSNLSWVNSNIHSDFEINELTFLLNRDEEQKLMIKLVESKQPYTLYWLEEGDGGARDIGAVRFHNKDAAMIFKLSRP